MVWRLDQGPPCRSDASFVTFHSRTGKSFVIRVAGGAVNPFCRALRKRTSGLTSRRPSFSGPTTPDRLASVGAVETVEAYLRGLADYKPSLSCQIRVVLGLFRSYRPEAVVTDGCLRKCEGDHRVAHLHSVTGLAMPARRHNHILAIAEPRAKGDWGRDC